MQLSIRHETTYAYTAPVLHSIQQLHLTPRTESQQRILAWEITTPGKLHAYTDAYGNRSHMLTLDGMLTSHSIVAEGMIETIFPYQGRLFNKETMSPLLFTASTPLTQSAPAILAMAAACLPRQAALVRSTDLLRLADSIFAAVTYESGATMVTTTANDALLLGRGVCQDHAHLFLACCHAYDIPARYVSGYIDPGNTGHAASHAWVDAWVEDSDFSGWVSVDVTHARLMTDAYCRMAIGRDYDSAAPIRGLRRGGGEEILSVDVQIQPI